MDLKNLVLAVVPRDNQKTMTRVSRVRVRVRVVRVRGKGKSAGCGGV